MKKTLIIFILIAILIVAGYNNSKLNSIGPEKDNLATEIIVNDEDIFTRYDFVFNSESDTALDFLINKNIEPEKNEINMSIGGFRELQLDKPDRNNQNTPPQEERLIKIKEHEVKQGENLWIIAEKYNLDVDTLIGANDINNMNRIKPHDILNILPVKGILYKVGPGENLLSISNRFKVRLPEVIEINSIKNPDRLKPGELLILPGAKPEFSYEDRLNQKFVCPVSARISSYFGKRWGRMHEGIDFATPRGSNIKAAGAGKIVWSGWVSGYGKTVIVEHQQGLRTLYAHNSRLLVRSGDWVQRGEIIAKSGNTGNSTGPHLHFEVQVNSRSVNPLDYINY